jgi:hypothetical protein
MTKLLVKKFHSAIRIKVTSMEMLRLICLFQFFPFTLIPFTENGKVFINLVCKEEGMKNN